MAQKQANMNLGEPIGRIQYGTKAAVCSKHQLRFHYKPDKGGIMHHYYLLIPPGAKLCVSHIQGKSGFRISDMFPAACYSVHNREAPIGCARYRSTHWLCTIQKHPLAVSKFRGCTWRPCGSHQRSEAILCGRLLQMNNLFAVLRRTHPMDPLHLNKGSLHK